MKLSNGYMPFNNYSKMYLAKWKRAALILLAIWIVVTYFMISPLKCHSNQEDVAEYQDKIDWMSSQLGNLKQQHSNLVAKVKKYSVLKGINDPLLNENEGPSVEYENLRRRIYSNTNEMWYYISNELNHLIKENPKWQAVLDTVGDMKRSLLSDQLLLPQLDDFWHWRQLEAETVSDLIQRRLKYLQNPPDCQEARKLVCRLNKGCGFGCQLHHIIYCLIFAYATERTLILNSKGWRYNSRGWDHVFEPLSHSCTSVYSDKVSDWPASYEAKVVALPFIDSMTQKPKFLPLAIPKDLANRIMRFNGDPASWWIGQMLKYILKPKESMQRAINATVAKMNFKKPIVGVHVRRTDKVGTEAAFHHVAEYMGHVKDYYDRLELTQKVDIRRVYLASDDPNVLDTARKKFPAYEFVGDASIAKTAATHRRYTPQSLTGLLVDLYMLSSCDYLVATFSSQVGRVAYEMMQANRMDASNSFFSLDDIFYYGGQNAHDRKAVLPHQAKTASEISFAVGDHIGIAGNHWDGFGRGVNRRTNANGLIPWYKTVDHLVLYPFPEYKQVPLTRGAIQNEL